MRTILSIAILLGLAGAGVFYYLRYYRSEGPANFRMAPIERGNMLPTIEATGSLEPEQVVDIGSQVNGLITDLMVDYGSAVEKDAVLAKVDDKLYKATFDQNQAAVNSAKANLKLAKANLALAQSNLNRDDKLRKTEGAIAPSQYDTDIAACKVAEANVGVIEASIAQAEATMRQAEVNLGYCDIKSPVKGTIVDRRVNVGQTVVSSLSASSLFLLAKDLSRIQVWASVNEADIGRIHPGVKVRFKVDAYPNETFVGEVAQIRLNATMTQNVVTYTVVVTTENKEMRLLPYMTASLLFEIDRHENVLKVPNAALRWKPRPKQIAADVREKTLADMNRPKRTDGGKDEGSKHAQQSAATAQTAEQPKNLSQNPSPEPTSQDLRHGSGMGSKPDANLASSAGTATGLTPADWKARTEKNARPGGQTPQAATPQGPKVAGGNPAPNSRTASQSVTALQDRQPPGRVLSAEEVKAAHKEHHESGRLWVAEGNFVKPIPVKIIATDGTMTEVRGKDISEGMEVVIGESVASDADSDTTNPFMPKLHSTKSGSSGGSKP